MLGPWSFSWSITSATYSYRNTLSNAVARQELNTHLVKETKSQVSQHCNRWIWCDLIRSPLYHRGICEPREIFYAATAVAISFGASIYWSKMQLCSLGIKKDARRNGIQLAVEQGVVSANQRTRPPFLKAERLAWLLTMFKPHFMYLPTCFSVIQIWKICSHSYSLEIILYGDLKKEFNMWKINNWWR